MKVANNPNATPDQVSALWLRDMDAALLHPNCPLHLLLALPEKKEVVVLNPSWAKHVKESPEEVQQFWDRVALEKVRDELYQELQQLCEGRAITRYDRAALICWMLECIRALPLTERVWRPFRNTLEQEVTTATIKQALQWAFRQNRDRYPAFLEMANGYKKCTRGLRYVTVVLQLWRTIKNIQYNPYVVKHRLAHILCTEFLGNIVGHLPVKERLTLHTQHLARLRAFKARQVPWVIRALEKKKIKI